MSNDTPEGPREGGANQHPEDDLTGEYEIPAQPRSASEHVDTAPADTAPADTAAPTGATDAGGEQASDAAQEESIAVTRDGEATVHHVVDHRTGGATAVEPVKDSPTDVAPLESTPGEVEPATAPVVAPGAIVEPAAGPEAEPETPPETVAAPETVGAPETVPGPDAATTAETPHGHPVTEAYDEAPASGPAWAPEPPAAGAGPAGGPVYVTAPTPPKRRGNRAAGILIALVATVAFAVVDALVVLGLFTLNHQGNVLDDLVRYIATPAFWATAIIYGLALILLVAIANRGGWWWYVLGGFLVAVVVYFAYIGATLLTNAWVLAPSEVGRFVSQLWSHPLTIATAVVAREVTIWFGAWIAARGRRVRARNVEAREAYDRDVAESRATARP